eukprot:TRINITY_DN2394_c0_g1_i1.p1 TRINITY_DN2394_c0_g1~~TRINITY_DN2394_c0_g1_i1.p1  ORF type:complete len:403 (+),score=128.91 TRINITY_DN2394_c0_g1_i1:177-1385(+)
MKRNQYQQQQQMGYQMQYQNPQQQQMGMQIQYQNPQQQQMGGQMQMQGFVSNRSNDGPAMEWSHIAQWDVSKPIKAIQVFSENHGNDIPIVVIPKWHDCLPYFRYEVPDGVAVLKQRFTKHDGLCEPGLKRWWWPWVRISHVVSLYTHTFNAPVKACPSRDNVMCEVDLSLNFRVIPEEVVKFVYNLGAHRLDELMHSLTSEGVRGLVNTVSYDKVHDLREEFADDMKKNLNKRLSAYGVEIVNVNIMAVRLPYSLGATLEGTTAFKTQMGQQHLSHKHNKQLTLNEASVTMTQIKEQNERSIQHVRHSKEVAFLDRERAKVVAQSNFAVAKVLAEKDAAVNIKRAEVGYSLAAIHGEKNAIELRRRVEAECKAKNKMVSQEVKTNLVESRTKLACKEAQSE